MFKLGDKVRCIDNSNRADVIKKGKVYIISEVRGSYYYLEEVNDNVYFVERRFELLTKCKATRLAKKLYPDAEVSECGEWIYV